MRTNSQSPLIKGHGWLEGVQAANCQAYSTPTVEVVRLFQLVSVTDQGGCRTVRGRRTDLHGGIRCDGTATAGSVVKMLASRLDVCGAGGWGSHSGCMRCVRPCLCLSLLSSACFAAVILAQVPPFWLNMMLL